MQRAFGKEIRETVAEMCRPDTSALLVCDAQVGLMSFIKDRERRRAGRRAEPQKP